LTAKSSQILPMGRPREDPAVQSAGRVGQFDSGDPAQVAVPEDSTSPRKSRGVSVLKSGLPGAAGNSS